MEVLIGIRESFMVLQWRYMEKILQRSSDFMLEEGDRFIVNNTFGNGDVIPWLVVMWA